MSGPPASWADAAVGEEAASASHDLQGIVDPQVKGCFNKPLEHTQKNLYQQDMKGFLSWLTRGFAWGVLYMGVL